MGVVLRWVFVATVAGWGLAELSLQVVQWRQGSRARTTEWRSFAVIVVAAVAGYALASVARSHVPALDLHLGQPVAFAIVLPVTWCGIGLRLWAIRVLGKYFRAVVHVQDDHQVVQRGPYRVLRHPSYTGLLLAILGISPVLGNGAAVAVLVLCAFGGVWYRITVEERVLLDALGADYADYAARTKRLIPGVW